MSTGNFSQTIQGHVEPIGYFQITSAAAATGLPSIPDKARYALIQPESQNIRWRDDGTNPTASVGMKLVANDTLVYSGVLSSFKLIEETGSAKVNVTYYK